MSEPDFIVIVLALGAVVFRLVSQATLESQTNHNQPPFPNLNIAASSMLRAASLWLLATAAGGLLPFWALLLSTLPIGLSLILRTPTQWGAAVDLLVLFLLGQASAPPISIPNLTLIIVSYAFLSFFAERYIARALPAHFASFARVALFGACIAGFVVLAFDYYSQVQRQWRPLASMGIAIPTNGHKSVLPTGAVGWLAEPQGDLSPYVALFLHGAHRAGARQAAAEPIRRAALSAGMPVFSLDSIGFGASPVPAHVKRPEAWSERANLAAAIKFLETRYAFKKIIVVGHSMGTGRALELAGFSSRKIEGVILFGAAPSFAAEGGDYWYKRFHRDRGLPENAVPFETWLQIEKTYEGVRLPSQLSDDHEPIVNVYFEYEHSNIIKSRNITSNAIPGRLLTVTLADSHHYFNAERIMHLTVCDFALVDRLNSLLLEWIRWMETSAD